MQFVTSMNIRLQKETNHLTIKINYLVILSKSYLNLASMRSKTGHVFWILKIC